LFIPYNGNFDHANFYAKAINFSIQPPLVVGVMIINDFQPLMFLSLWFKNSLTTTAQNKV
jgi:hypothetical protein